MCVHFVFWIIVLRYMIIKNEFGWTRRRYYYLFILRNASGNFLWKCYLDNLNQPWCAGSFNRRLSDVSVNIFVSESVFFSDMSVWRYKVCGVMCAASRISLMGLILVIFCHVSEKRPKQGSRKRKKIGVTDPPPKILIFLFELVSMLIKSS